MHQFIYIVVGALALLAPVPARALDKQGAAHAGAGDSAHWVDFTGSLAAGVALYNPSYAARPDNTGRALLRYAAHFDLDLIGRYLSVPLDLNFFTDRTRGGPAALALSEFDVIGGITSTVDLRRNHQPIGRLELGVRGENDRPLDQGHFSQTYVDARLRYVYQLKDFAPSLARALKGGDVRGFATLGWFIYNPTYAARPDNTGNALLRYALHGEVAAFDEHLGAGVDLTSFTDRRGRALAPSELDLTLELIGRYQAFEAHLAYERDMPIDRRGYTQALIYLLAVWTFDLRRQISRSE